MKKALNNNTFKEIGHVPYREWKDTITHYQSYYNLSAFDSAIRSGAIGYLAKRHGFGENKIFRIGGSLPEAPKTLFDFYEMGADGPMELFGLLSGIPFSYYIDDVVKIVENTIEMFLSKSFGKTFSELGNTSRISLSIWSDEEFIDKFAEAVEKIEKLMPNDKILKLNHAAAPFYLSGRYMTLNKDLLGSAHPDELKHFISDNLLNPLTNEHIRDTLYRESKKLAIYGIEKFSEREKRLKEDDDYVDEIVEYF
jgi:hypothetical protein